MAGGVRAVQPLLRAGLRTRSQHTLPEPHHHTHHPTTRQTRCFGSSTRAPSGWPRRPCCSSSSSCPAGMRFQTAFLVACRGLYSVLSSSELTKSSKAPMFLSLLCLCQAPATGCPGVSCELCLRMSHPGIRGSQGERPEGRGPASPELVCLRADWHTEQRGLIWCIGSECVAETTMRQKAEAFSLPSSTDSRPQAPCRSIAHHLAKPHHAESAGAVERSASSRGERRRSGAVQGRRRGRRGWVPAHQAAHRQERGSRCGPTLAR